MPNDAFSDVLTPVWHCPFKFGTSIATDRAKQVNWTALRHVRRGSHAHNELAFMELDDIGTNASVPTTLFCTHQNPMPGNKLNTVPIFTTCSRCKFQSRCHCHCYCHCHCHCHSHYHCHSHSHSHSHSHCIATTIAALCYFNSNFTHPKPKSTPTSNGFAANIGAIPSQSKAALWSKSFKIFI